jgi:hypothetical protein
MGRGYCGLSAGTAFESCARNVHVGLSADSAPASATLPVWSQYRPLQLQFIRNVGVGLSSLLRQLKQIEIARAPAALCCGYCGFYTSVFLEDSSVTLV